MRRVRSYRFAILAIFAFAPPVEGKAEGFFDFLFGSPEPQARSAGPARSLPARRTPSNKGAVGELRFARPHEGLAGVAEPSTGGYCVRICDGYYFPLIKSSQATRQQSCEFACPSAPMEIYDGASIEQARNYKGQRYTALPTAFAFRDKTTKKCSCNDPQTSQAFFLSISRTDPTLRSGDVVVQDAGVFVYSGTNLVPLSRAGFMPPQIRQRLRAMLSRAASPKPSLNEVLEPRGSEVELSKVEREGTQAR